MQCSSFGVPGGFGAQDYHATTCDDYGRHWSRVITLLPFIQTLFEIAVLRKGPQHIPRSNILLTLAVLLWLLAVLCQVAVIRSIDESDFVMELFSALVGVICFSAIVVAFGKAPRLTQTITAILGCGALIAFAFAFAYVFLQAIGSPVLTLLVVWAIVLWSVSVKGHIIASAIDRHWYAGLAVAVAVFIFQHVVHVYISAP